MITIKELERLVQSAKNLGVESVLLYTGRDGENSYSSLDAELDKINKDEIVLLFMER